MLAQSHVADIQRARLLAGAVRAVDELGYTRATVTDITARARVSRRTFYELFANCEDCLAAVLEGTVEQLRGELAGAGLGDLPWRERVREGLWRILSYLDSEPALARLCVVQSARGGRRVLEWREEIIAELATTLAQGLNESKYGADCPALTGEGLVGACLSILNTRLLQGAPEPLTVLQGELMSLIVLPYLGPAAAREERTRPAPAEVAKPPGSTGRNGGPSSHGEPSRSQEDPLAEIPMRLTYRTARVLEAVAKCPGISNREAGEQAGVSDQGQMSKLLGRLERYGLLENPVEAGKGEANAWQLTPAGHQVARVIGIGTHEQGETA